MTNKHLAQHRKVSKFIVKSRETSHGRSSFLFGPKLRVLPESVRGEITRLIHERFFEADQSGARSFSEPY